MIEEQKKLTCTKGWLAPLRIVGVGVGLSVLAGCAAIGKSEFSCTGPNAGLGCMPSSEVYEITNDPDLYAAVMDALNHASREQGNVDHRKIIEEVRATFVRTGHSLVKPMAEPVSQPLPVLEPARVVRIWISPWVDAKGDLRMPGYVFTEITPRRWSFGEPEVMGSEILAPIQVERDTGIR